MVTVAKILTHQKRFRFDISCWVLYQIYLTQQQNLAISSLYYENIYGCIIHLNKSVVLLEWIVLYKWQQYWNTVTTLFCASMSSLFFFFLKKITYQKILVVLISSRLGCQQIFDCINTLTIFAIYIKKKYDMYYIVSSLNRLLIDHTYDHFHFTKFSKCKLMVDCIYKW